MEIIPATTPCFDTMRPRLLEGASSERGYACGSPLVAIPSARCTAPWTVAVRGTGLPSFGLSGRRSAAVAGHLPTFATKPDSTGVRGWSPPV